MVSFSCRELQKLSVQADTDIDEVRIVTCTCMFLFLKSMHVRLVALKLSIGVSEQALGELILSFHEIGYRN